MNKIFLTAILLFFGMHSYAAWSAMGVGFDGNVNALCVHDGELYAGGNFTHSGSATISHIAKWDGSNWQQVGNGISGNVKALISFNGELYAGGLFSAIASGSGNVVKWNGSNWSDAGNGLGGIAGSSVTCFYEWNGELYAGGTFSSSGTVVISKIAKQVSNAWQQVGGGGPNHCSAGVYCMTAFDNELYVGGQGSSPNMDKLVGNAWDNVWIQSAGNGPDFWVYALGVFPIATSSNLALWIGGTFQSPSPRMCTYQPSMGFGTSVNAFSAASVGVNAIITTPQFLYAGGDFTVNGLHSASKLAKKSIFLPWDSVSASFNFGVNALCTYQNFLVAGGAFTLAGNTTVNHVSMSDGLTLGEEGIIPRENSFGVFPNPAHESVTFTWNPLDVQGTINLKLFNSTGQLIEEKNHAGKSSIADEGKMRLDMTQKKSGIYFYLAEADNGRIASGKVTVE